MTTMTNKEFREKLKEFPDDAAVVVEYCDISHIKYDAKNNIIKID